MDPKQLALKLTSIERLVLGTLKQHTLDELVKKTKHTETEVMRALQWLANKKLVTIKKTVTNQIILGKLGKQYVKKLLPELRLLKSLTKPTNLSDVCKSGVIDKQELQIALGKLREYSAIKLTKKDNETILEKQPNAKQLISKGTIEQQFLSDLPLNLDKLTDEQRFAYDKLKKRGDIIDQNTIKVVTAKKLSLADEVLKIKTKKLYDKLTPAMLKESTWKNKTFRHYDVEVNVPTVSGGRKHPTAEVIEFVKQIWLDMGFKEMKGPMLEESFWNFDALFIPQDHSAREMQDALFTRLKRDPTKNNKQKYTAVKKQQLQSWRIWDDDKTKELVLRTHTTNLSARTIAGLKKDDLPTKFFSVGKVFRNETLDWTHLFEFYQVEGIVIDPNVTFNDLIGYLKIFFKKMGFDQIRIRPAYFPYVSQGTEVEVFHPVKKKWIELGGAGVFRPEVVKPLMGVDTPVLAWGLGMGRIMMEYYGINDIRDLYKNDLKTLQNMKSWVR
ncbi:hypothetical protein CL622_02705 [archaeon]|nr:hypothetical protein [archaeon]